MRCTVGWPRFVSMPLFGAGNVVSKSHEDPIRHLSFGVLCAWSRDP